MWCGVVYNYLMKICNDEKWHPVDVCFIINSEICPKLGNPLRKQKKIA